MSNNFTLNNSANSLILTEQGQLVFPAAIYEVYTDVINSNIILVEYFYEKGEQLPDNILFDVTERTPEKAYDYLINVLNTSKHTLVNWTRWHDEEAHYSIYFDAVDDCRINRPEIICTANEQVDASDIEAEYILSQPYCEVRNGKTYLPNFVN